MTELILASNSPRRRDLLKQLGLDFTVDPADVDERILAAEMPEQYALRVAADKAEVASRRARSGIVIAADTVVVLDGLILGKPADAEDAERMLSLLSGRRHQVMTGLVLRDAATGRLDARVAVSSVWFKRLSPGEIRAYVATGEPLDKAGAYGIQERGALLVERIEGCYFNIVGLPLSLLGEMLRNFDIVLL
jgi:septum formation protein